MLVADLEATKKSLDSTTKKLSTEKFLKHAKPEVLEETKKKKVDLLAKVQTIEAQVKEFEALK